MRARRTKKRISIGLVLLASMGATGSWGRPWYTTNTTEWPNAISCANSDEWLVRHHDEIRVMRPRVLVINFANANPAKRMREQTEQLIRALAESSRYHGYKNAGAPAFLQYEVFKYVDLRDGKSGNSALTPVKRHAGPGAMNFDNGALFSERYAVYWGVRDPRDAKRYLRLDELIEQGYVHEVWYFIDPDGKVRCFECVEMKPRYDEEFRRVSNEWVQAGNGGDEDQPWIGRSVRINCLNWTRGIGCGFENLGHALEGMAHSGAIPYFTKYFYEYAMFDLDKRYGLPFTSLYAVKMEPRQIRYPARGVMEVIVGGRTYTVSNYVAAGGNVHFPPNATGHYDQNNTVMVLSTIEDWRIGSGADGKDLAKPWNSGVLRRYERLAPDCMGKWLVYWRQNMPGLENRQRDEKGQRMKNWWGFLFY
ncbi:MAG: hypothetical protein N2595_01740 [bacterium]|nr:hypothetical protein [bacterium]